MPMTVELRCHCEGDDDYSTLMETRGQLFLSPTKVQTQEYVCPICDNTVKVTIYPNNHYE